MTPPTLTNIKLISETGIHRILKPYQAWCVLYLWDNANQYSGCGSAEVWNKYNETHPKRISRASVINSMNGLVEQELVGFHEVTGQGGRRRMYFMALDRLEFYEWVMAGADKALMELAMALGVDP